MTGFLSRSPHPNNFHSVIPIYQAEVSTPETRGFMVSMTGVCFAIGYMLSAWIGYGVYFISASGSNSSFPWRFPLAFQGAPALLLLAGSKLLPFSPRWLMQQDRHDEAHAVLKRLHARKGQALDEQAELLSTSNLTMTAPTNAGIPDHPAWYEE